MGLSPILLAKKPEVNPRIANPPAINGISTEKLMYNPPIAPVIRPIHGPARMPLIRMGNWVKWMLEFRDPIAIGITKGGNDRMFDRAAITAIKVMVFVVLTWNFKMVTLYPDYILALSGMFFWFAVLIAEWGLFCNFFGYKSRISSSRIISNQFFHLIYIVY